MSTNPNALLPFRRHVRIADQHGRSVSEEYDIPPNARAAVLGMLYPFAGDCPALTETLFDLHAGKKFLVHDFKVVREANRNYLVSPYYYESGGTVIDWVPEDWGD